MKKITLLLLSVFLCNVFAEIEMEYEKDYLPKLEEAKTRLKNAEAGIMNEEEKKAELNRQIAETDEQINNTWNEIYSLIGSDKAGVDQFRTELAAMEKEIKSFGAMPNEEMYKQQEKLDVLQKKIEEKRTDKRSALTEFHNKLNNMERMIKSIKNSIVVPYMTSYVVQKGDNLWRISAKEKVYNDPYQWTKIYKANKEVIGSWQRKFGAQLKEGQNEEDLIYPDQEFTIPR